MFPHLRPCIRLHANLNSCLLPPLVLTQNPYLDLMRHALVNFIYKDDAYNVLPPYKVVPFRDYDRAYGKNFPSRC